MEALEGRALLSVAGGPDLTYGTDGYGRLPTSVAYSPFTTFGTTASVLQPNGDLIIVGSVSATPVGALGALQGTTTGFFAYRYTPQGTVDSTFNANLGVSGLTVRSGGEFPSPTPVYAGATGVALTSTGKIVIVGEVTGVAKVIMLNSDGTLDTAFGTGGIVTLGTVANGDNLLDYASTVQVLAGDVIAVGGAAVPSAGHESPAVELLNPDGTIVSSYGANGLALVPLPANAQSFGNLAPSVVDGGYRTFSGSVTMVAQAGGVLDLAANAVLTGATGVEIVVTRLTAAGVVDTTFGTGGQATITPSSVVTTSVILTTTSVSGTALALDSNDDLIVGGEVFAPNSVGRAFVARLTAAGVPDPTFGYGGATILPFPLVQDLAISANIGAIAIQANGKFVVADATAPVFYRLDYNGSLDTTFGNAGIAVATSTLPVLQTGLVTLPTNTDTASLQITTGGQILAAQSDLVGGVRELLSQGAVNDFDGDGISDRAIFMTSLGNFAYIPSSGGIGPIIHFGVPGAGQNLMAPGAYGGEGVDELAVYLPTFGAFAIRSFQTGQSVLVPFGNAGPGVSLPAPGDYDESGATELAIYDPVTAVYAYRPANGGPDVYVSIGTPGSGSVPVPADYFGTGQDDVAVYDTSTASYIINDPANGQTYTIPFGIPGVGNSIPVPGDYDGSGLVELAVYLPTQGSLVYRSVKTGTTVTVPFGPTGVGQTIPASGDYDGSGHLEVGAYLPASGIYAYRPATGTSDVYQQIGIPGSTVPYTLNSGFFGIASPGGSVSAKSFAETAVEIPLTPDVLDTLTGTVLKKKVGVA